MTGSWIWKIKLLLESSARYLELIIVAAIVMVVAIGLIDLFKYGHLVYTANVSETYQVFQSFLGYALMLIVGIELILTLLFHSSKAILELITFVIARKMLVYAQTMTDLVLGAVAIFIIFMTIHFFAQNEEAKLLSNEEKINS